MSLQAWKVSGFSARILLHSRRNTNHQYTLYCFGQGTRQAWRARQEGVAAECSRGSVVHVSEGMVRMEGAEA